jgi:CheY-like chemotaxis protein
MMRVLIVEDNPKMRELLKVVLKGAAETITECSDGDEAMEAFLSHKPDWVVMDVRMERIGGIAATRLLKKAFPTARIVMLSKHADEEIQTAARLAGACGYFVKDDLTALRSFLLKKKNFTGDV